MSKKPIFLVLILILAFLIFPLRIDAIPMLGRRIPAEQQRRELEQQQQGSHLNRAAEKGAAAGVEEKEDQEEEKEENRNISPLENFRVAAANPDFAELKRLIIDPKSSAIRPWSSADGKIKGKNETIIAALKAALQDEVPTFSSELITTIVEEELPQQSMWEKLGGKPDLSTEALQRILAKVDNAMEERAFAEEHSFTLQHFRNAIAHPNNQGAERLIISGQGASAMILPRAESNHAEDTIVRKTLKRALEREGHRKDFVHTLVSEMLPRLGMLRKIRPPLSFEKLKTIIQRADDAIAELKLLQATRSVAPHLSPIAANRTAARALLRSGIEHFFSRLGIQNVALAANISAAVVTKSAEEVATEHAAAAQQEAWEQSECEKILHSIICRNREPNALKEHYREAEAAAIAAEAHHDQAEKVQREAGTKEKTLTHARDFFEKVKAALDEKRDLAEFDESTLNKISQGANMASVFLGMFNLPFVNAQGVATAISTFATVAEQRLTIAEAQKAYKQLQTAIQEAEASAEGHEQVEKAATKMQTHSEEIESHKKQEDCDETIRLSTLVRLPSDLTDDALLRAWATELACETDAINEEQATTTAYLLYKQAKKNPDQIHELVCKLWGERVGLLDREISGLAHLPKATPLEAEYQHAQKKEIEAEANASVARARLEAAAQAQREWLCKRDQLRAEKKVLEDQLKTHTEHRKERQTELNAKRSEFSAHQAQKEAIDSTYQAAATEAKGLTTAATRAHTEAFEKFKTYDRGKEHHARNSARFKAAADVDQKMFDAILIAEDHRKSAEADIKSAQALEAKAAVFKKSDRKTTKLHYEVARTFKRVRSCYSTAAKEQVQRNREAADAYRKSAQACEAQVAALIRGDTKAAEFHNQIAWALSNVGHSYSSNAAKVAQGNKESADAYRKSAQVYEAQLAALIKGDTKAAEPHQEIASLLEIVGHFYTRATWNQAKGNKEAAAAYRKCAQAYEATAAALAKGDTKSAELHQKVARILEKAGYAYTNCAEKQAQGNREAADAYCKSAQAFEAKAAALAQELEALTKGDTEAAELHEQIAWSLHNAGQAYSEAAEAQAQGNKEAADAYRKRAQAFEAQAAALAQQIEALAKQDKDATSTNTAADAKSESTTSSSSQQNSSQQEKPKDSTSAEKEKEKENCTIS